MKLQQGQVWRKDLTLIRIVALERLSVTYKFLGGRESAPTTTHLKMTKKAFCRLIKDAVLLAPNAPAVIDASFSTTPPEAPAAG
jgi:hypothetical protein